MKRSEMIEIMQEVFYGNLEHNTMDYIMNAILTKQEELGMLLPILPDPQYYGDPFGWEDETTDR